MADALRLAERNRQAVKEIAKQAQVSTTDLVARQTFENQAVAVAQEEDATVEAVAASATGCGAS